LGKKYKYEDREWLLESPFCIQDVMLNAVLIRSCFGLIKVADYLGKDYSELNDWVQMASQAFNHKLWNDEINFYTSYDQKSDASIDLKEVGGASSLVSGLSEDKHYHGIATWLEELNSKGYYLCPSFDPEHRNFDSCRYWRGPVWPQMNWLLYEGLKQGGYNELAIIVKNDFIELVHKFGFYEYFEASKSKAKEVTSGYGGSHFSWTAACYIDLLHQA
jgi:glycogen debranching enzyme